jgi:hypothetical protein
MMVATRAAAEPGWTMSTIYCQQLPGLFLECMQHTVQASVGSCRCRPPAAQRQLVPSNHSQAAAVNSCDSVVRTNKTESKNTPLLEPRAPILCSQVRCRADIAARIGVHTRRAHDKVVEELHEVVWDPRADASPDQHHAAAPGRRCSLHFTHFPATAERRAACMADLHNCKCTVALVMWMDGMCKWPVLLLGVRPICCAHTATRLTAVANQYCVTRHACASGPGTRE